MSAQLSHHISGQLSFASHGRSIVKTSFVEIFSAVGLLLLLRTRPTSGRRRLSGREWKDKKWSFGREREEKYVGQMESGHCRFLSFLSHPISPLSPLSNVGQACPTYCIHLIYRSNLRVGNYPRRFSQRNYSFGDQ